MKINQLKSVLYCIMCSIVLLTSCTDTGDDPKPVFGVAFKTTELGIPNDKSNIDAVLSSTMAATEDHTIIINVHETGVVYGKEYSTTPAVKDGKITLEIPKGSEEVKFTIARLVDFISAGTEVEFTIEKVTGEYPSRISGNTSLKLTFVAITSPDGTIKAKTGGPGQPNMVFVDLSLASQASAERTEWDLGFYNGDEDKVILNYSTFMLAKALTKTDMNKVGEADKTPLQDAMKTMVAGSKDMIDHSDGDLSKTVIEVSDVDADNKVYILNLGAGPGSSKPSVGQHNVAAIPRGWKKIRILKSGNNYKLQYADIAATDFEEATIERDPAYNFTYFSLVNGESVKIAPPKTKWDFVFTPCTNRASFPGGPGRPGIARVDGEVAYGFSDFVLTNRHGGTKVYMVNNNEDKDDAPDRGTINFDSFSLRNVENNKLSENANGIGSNWRELVMSRSRLYSHRYFILKDSEGNVYKIKFTAFKNEAGERGHPAFEYKLLK